MSNSTVKERLKEYISFKNISTRFFEKTTGLSYGYVGNMRVSIQPDKICSIASCFPDLNTGWLLTGEGEMLKTSQARRTSPNEPTQDSILDVYKEQIVYYKEQIIAQQKEIQILNKQLGKLEGKLESAYELMEDLKKEIPVPGFLRAVK